MKKMCILLFVTILIVTNSIACGLKKDTAYKTPKEQAEDIAENVYNAIINHDSELLKNQFCQRLQSGKETAMDKIYDFLDGEIETLETDLDNDPTYADVGGGKTRYDKRSKGFSFRIFVITDKGSRYRIAGKGDIINTIVPKNEGLQRILIYRQNEDGTWDYTDNYLDIGTDLDDSTP
ncbi:MAG: DUF5104 domain-containing protein [Lachnospira sp.]